MNNTKSRRLSCCRDIDLILRWRSAFKSKYFVLLFYVFPSNNSQNPKAFENLFNRSANVQIMHLCKFCLTTSENNDNLFAVSALQLLGVFLYQKLNSIYHEMLHTEEQKTNKSVSPLSVSPSSSLSSKMYCIIP